MGASHSHPIFLALQELLNSEKLKLKERCIEKFLKECDVVAPWFAVSGSLTIPSWDKLGRELDFAYEQGTLGAGVRLIWKMIRSCLEDRHCSDMVDCGQAALEQLQEERSEKSRSERGSEVGEERVLYPDPAEFEFSEVSKTESEEEGEEDLAQDMATLEVREEQQKKQEREIGHWVSPARSGVEPSAMPPYLDTGGARSKRSFNVRVWQRVRTEMPTIAFPVFQDDEGNRSHHPLDFKVIKALAESVKTYGITAPFTIAQVEALSRSATTPTDWAGLARACLNPGQYLDWRSFLTEFAGEQAAANHAAGNAAWDQDMLLGAGRFANAQTGYPVQVYEQVNQIAIRAWKALPNRGEVSGNLTKIIQGPTEPFSDFVARMVEAAGRMFGDAEAAMPLIKQLVYEQCTGECRAAITPYKHRGLEVWMKCCRELGGPLTNAGLAAAVMQFTKQRRKGMGTDMSCFSCGRKGHMK